jgi:hypothetical protein
MTMMQERREQCAEKLLANAAKVPKLKAFVGLDGFVDDIMWWTSGRTRRNGRGCRK